MNIGSTHAITGKFETEALSVVCLQTAPISAQTMDDVQKNTDTICDFMDKAVGGFPGVDLIVTIECGLQGFGPDVLTDNVLLDWDSPQIKQLQNKCRELDVWGVFDPIFKDVDGHKNCNTAIIINNEGEMQWSSKATVERMNREFALGFITKLAMFRAGYSMQADGTMARSTGTGDEYTVHYVDENAPES